MRTAAVSIRIFSKRLSSVVLPLAKVLLRPILRPLRLQPPCLILNALSPQRVPMGSGRQGMP